MDVGNLISSSSVQSLSRVWLFATPWTAACQASLSITTPRVYSNSCPLSQWCHPTISSSIILFSSCLQSFPASGSFPMSQLSLQVAKVLEFQLSFLNPAWTSWFSGLAGLENFEHYFPSMWDECNCVVVWAFFGIAFLWDWNENWPFPVLWPLLSFPNLLAYWVQHFHRSIF